MQVNRFNTAKNAHLHGYIKVKFKYNIYIYNFNLELNCHFSQKNVTIFIFL